MHCKNQRRKEVMDNKHGIFSMLPRKGIFLFKEAAEGMLRRATDTLDEIEELGERLGQAILQSFKDGRPIKGLYLYGHAGRAKEILLESVIRSFDNAEGLSFDWKEHRKIQSFNCRPAVRLVPNNMFEPAIKGRHPLKEEEILISRWSGGSSEKEMEQNRIEVELLVAESEDEAKNRKAASLHPKADNFHTFASLVGVGGGIAAVESLKS